MHIASASAKISLVRSLAASAVRVSRDLTSVRASVPCASSPPLSPSVAFSALDATFYHIRPRLFHRRRGVSHARVGVSLSQSVDHLPTPREIGRRQRGGLKSRLGVLQHRSHRVQSALGLGVGGVLSLDAELHDRLQTRVVARPIVRRAHVADRSHRSLILRRARAFTSARRRRASGATPKSAV
ncbi:hypothetical protein BE221DRAFT_119903 [Ostreococcus tauri]|uniref:Uncharacterized protein n=1 Tax=Ostreococcus tauri TaxID=70448 RepID=A0A1Y5I1S6_OSTTA|nr:hypothetical protein BE221DRAFT_119903 [Ostreococcus tauri]